MRNTSYRWLQKNRVQQSATEFDEAIHSGPGTSDPQALILQDADRRMVEQALNALPPRSREVLVLRELEGLAYKEIAEVIGVPIGTVMSSLSRARERFRTAVLEQLSSALTAGPAGR